MRQVRPADISALRPSLLAGGSSIPSLSTADLRRFFALGGTPDSFRNVIKPFLRSGFSREDGLLSPRNAY
jgi:hypothetical protein